MLDDKYADDDDDGCDVTERDVNVSLVDSLDRASAKVGLNVLDEVDGL